MELVPSYLLEAIVDPWYRSLDEPAESQLRVLRSLLKGYSATEYGRLHGAEGVSDASDYASSFPITNYQGYSGLLNHVQAGRPSVLLPEPVVRWVMTRGTTGRPKMIPATEAHLSLILSMGARAIVNFALRGESKVLSRGVLNLNFPSEVGSVESRVGGGSYGYSSGTYAKLNPELGQAALVPRQEEIDGIGPGIKKADWERRFELVYSRALHEDIGCVMGVTPVIVAFARHVRRRHGVSPKGLWHLDALFCTSVAKIQTAYAPLLRHLFGDIPVVEMYTATEGVFAQQLDDLPYVLPNFDGYYFEAKTGNGLKMLHEMKRGEWGRLVVSTPIFPRYDIGDFIEAEGKNYFRVLGRAKRTVALEHILFNLLTARGF